MTTTPFIYAERRTGRIASTAAWSTFSLSPRPMKREPAIAAASVARTSSSARLRSRSGGREPEAPTGRRRRRGCGVSARRTTGASDPGRRRSGPHARWSACRGAWHRRGRYPVASGPRRERLADVRCRGCPGHEWRERSCIAEYPFQGSTQHFLVSVSLEPVEGPRHGLLPELVVLVALGGVHRRLPALVLGPVLAQVLLVAPEARREPGRVRRAERGGLGHLRPDDWHAEQVGLELHQQVVLHHAAVDLERFERDARVGVHRLDDLAALVGRG